ncbi:MAG: hypothetical protein AB1779_10030 [Candidatus Thermoplasmatota archaeon]
MEEKEIKEKKQSFGILERYKQRYGEELEPPIGYPPVEEKEEVKPIPKLDAVPVEEKKIEEKEVKEIAVMPSPIYYEKKPITARSIGRCLLLDFKCFPFQRYAKLRKWSGKMKIIQYLLLIPDIIVYIIFFIPKIIVFPLYYIIKRRKKGSAVPSS